MKKRLISGIKPTGIIHLGNYFGAIKQLVELQDEYESFVFIADFHALTTVQDKKELSTNILNVAMDYLACGLDPEKVCLFRQSDIPEVTELTWYFNCITTVPYLERATSYKDAVNKNKEANVGLFDYPILMAADILIQNADIVPVGSDQKQHVEYARDTAQKFNNIFGKTFKIPEARIVENLATIPGVDGRKMSKNYNNVIPLFGSDEEIKKAVMSIVTNSLKPEESKDPEKCNIFTLHKLFLKNKELENLRKKYLQGGLSYKESKEILLKEIIDFVGPMRERRKFYEKNKNKVLEILDDGKIKAGGIAQNKIKLVRSQIGINF